MSKTEIEKNQKKNGIMLLQVLEVTFKATNYFKKAEDFLDT